MRDERRLTKTQPPAVWRPAHDVEQHQDGRARRAVCCALAGVLLCAPIWFMAYMNEHYYWQPHGIVAASAIGVMIAGVIWLYDEILGS